MVFGRHRGRGFAGCSIWLAAGLAAAADPAPPPPAKPQYEHAGLVVPAAAADEPLAAAFDLAAGLDYLEKGNAAWNGARQCVACHTSGVYMTVRPALGRWLGPPAASGRDHFVKALAALEALEKKDLGKSTRPAQVIYAAAGLAEWDAHVTGSLSAETRRALRLMFELQLESGTFGTLECWPPYESDAYHEATVAAMAAATAPGWLAEADEPTRARVEALRRYVVETPPPHDYSRLLLLWTATRWPDLVPADRRRELLEMVWRHQRADGGWSLRSFAAPEAWGNGSRAAKLRAEPEFADPPSDGHLTGLAVVVLRDAGIDATDPRLERAVAWLLANQRVSGRWWTRSLNTDGPHFITYSGTAFPILALAKCGKLPETPAAIP